MAEQPEDDNKDETRAEGNGPSTGEVRIAAVEAAVAAGLVHPHPEDEEVAVEQPTEAYELPNWADPPTGQVPRVLLDHPDAERPDAVRGPTWREASSDWAAETDLSIFAAVEPDESDDTVIAGTVEPGEAPFTFSFEELERGGSPVEGTEPEAAWAPLLNQEEAPEDLATLRSERRRHASSRSRRGATEPAPKGRDGRVATLTGLGLAALVAVCLLLGALATLVLAALALTLTAGEAFAALQRAGYRPATLVGLLTVPAFVVAAYLRQGSGIMTVLGCAVVLTALFHLLRPPADPLVSMATTLFVAVWVGGLGAFGGLLLAPAQFPHRHGVTLVFAAVLLTVAHDVGSFVVGSRVGRHRIAPDISPGKTLEGLVGGTLLTVLVAVLAVGMLHPFGRLSALELGVLVSAVAPLGDLTESMVKRDLELKDMGNLLPGHGGLFDRVDALLFVLPATYALARLAHLS
ncbi:MAG TPA: phosphatidate cytidylyltransferase [Acidimicrobiales bacterium]|nr:phosphatidate cytidylyltransferase [Acidimicrobiales bacterium]